jgi:regulator of RNase E activity RraA
MHLRSPPGQWSRYKEPHITENTIPTGQSAGTPRPSALVGPLSTHSGIPAKPPAKKPSSAAMHPGAGFRLRRWSDRPDPATVTGLGQFNTADISDIMNRLYTMSAGVGVLTDPAGPIIGTACTVKVFPGDNLMVHKALDIAEPGDVVVVDAQASTMTAVLGGLISTKARHRGIAGFVVDGLVRDLQEILALGDLPVFARGTTPIGPLQRGPGEINYPISAGGMVVGPGDVIVGDRNGVVVVPHRACEEVLSRLREKAAREADYVAAVAAGAFSNSWVDDILVERGIALSDEAGAPADVTEEDDLG